MTDELKRAEMKLAVYIAAHCSVRSMDHLGEILKKLGKGSILQDIRMHRTKCSKLISEVVTPVFQKELIDDIGDSPYALIVDEVTDCSTTKFMGVCVRYFSKDRRHMVTDFLGLVAIQGCSGKELADVLKAYLLEIGLPLRNLRAIGTDGAPNMCGLINSFYTHLKKDVPGLWLFKCICHSIDKCAEHAFKSLPQEFVDLITDTNNWFAHSPQRWGEYTAYYKVSGLREGVF